MINTFKKLEAEHLPEVWRIEQSAHSHPWSQNMINDLASRGACHYGMFQNEQLVGYFYAQNIIGEVTLLNIAIDPAKHRQGLGLALTEFFLETCQQADADSAWLEVRESNLPAFNLYESQGFNEVDRRRNYYPTERGQEDAIIMSYIFF
ncbi:ribosomal-protein-alanine N-acetyltransferase [Vibrio sp. 10N.286.49.B3]|uniref:ribosomal protein S18-alanine N-acetyltransferase n=1 Tax=Vibrio sp. 10N.286.49.B3 TaxID=1880855 RepID=UPI000C82C4C9|nr:ribosomal protein S18-alanine N-acetyltransferase [Vibrio sp. 10N.286.49.B3]PMH41182.1 ribosomal-protein-alanine N-acetyltransferase [Vibrio sp. 10N.286.49.B3]